MAKRNIMAKFKLSAIAAVDSPAQKGARAVIMKRDDADGMYLAKADDAAALPDGVEEYLKRSFTHDQRDQAASTGAAMPDGSFPINTRADLENAIRAIGRAKDPAKAKSHIIARARALDATSILPTDWKVGKFIGGDLVIEIARVAPRVLPDLIDNVIKVEEYEAEVAKIEDAKVRKSTMGAMTLAKTALVASAWSIVDAASPEDMASLLRKNFEEYKDHALGLVAGVEPGTKVAKAGEESMALKDIAKSLGLAETATEAEIQTQVTKNAADLAKANTIASLTGTQHLYYEKSAMSDTDKAAFLLMKSDARDAVIKAKPMPKTKEDDDADSNGDDCIKVDGNTLRKRDIGDAAFAVLKSQQTRIEKAEETAAITNITKRVEPLKFVIAKADDTAAMLYRIGKGTSTAEDAKSVETLLKSANEICSKSEVITAEFGKRGGEGGFAKAADEINSRAQELRKKDSKLTMEKARDQVRQSDADLAKRENEEARAARGKAA